MTGRYGSTLSLPKGARRSIKEDSPNLGARIDHPQMASNLGACAGHRKMGSTLSQCVTQDDSSTLSAPQGTTYRAHTGARRFPRSKALADALMAAIKTAEDACEDLPGDVNGNC